MYLLYLDDAGSVGNPREKHFVLGGVALFERQTHFLSEALDQLARKWQPLSAEELEFHGSEINAGRNTWRKVPKDKRRAIIRHGLATVRSLQGDWTLFGVAVDKKARSPEDPIEYAFEQLCNRFDRFLQRKYRKNDKQKGLIILDKSAKETRLQALATEFRKTGHRWGTTRNMADVPMFVDSRSTRMIQYADLVAYAMWCKYEKSDAEFFNVIDDSFDSEGGVVHGLHHFKDRNEYCDCIACAPRLI